jgi:hypothetical protein
MSDNPKNVVLKAFRLLLQPLVRILLRSGVTWKEAAEVCKTTFVAVATNEYGLHGRPTNLSRVAIMTGIGRRDVSRLRKLLAEEQPADLRGMNSATRLLTGWHLDSDYLNDSGAPRELVFDGGLPSFSTLARKYAADTAPITMLRELQRVGAVEAGSEGRLRALKRFYMPLAMDTGALLRAGSVLQDLGNTIDYNLVRGAAGASRFEGRASNARVRCTDAAAYREFVETEAQGFLEHVDEWLARHEIPEDVGRKQKTVRLGIGVFQIQDDPD